MFLYMEKKKIPKTRFNFSEYDREKLTLALLDRFFKLVTIIRKSESKEFIYNPDEEYFAIEGHICHILRSVKESDSAFFYKKRLKYINQLTTYASAECILVTLDVFEMFGTEVNIPAIKTLIKGQRITGRNPEIKERAESSLQAINARLENRKDKFSLLHPIMDYDPTELLRPNSNSWNDETVNLLRIPAQDEKVESA